MRSDKPVKVFKNHALGCYTVMRGTEVVASARQVRLEDVEFLVRPSGRERMLSLGRRTIHAYAVGRLVDFIHLDDAEDLTPVAGRRATYHPERYGHFYDRHSETLLQGARFVQLDENGLTYSGGIPVTRAEAA